MNPRTLLRRAGLAGLWPRLTALYRSATRLAHVASTPRQVRRREDLELHYRRRRWSTARLVPLLRPIDAMADNLELVTDALTAADVPYLLLANRSPHRHRVTVDAAHRGRALDALRAAAAGRTVHLAATLEGGTPRDPVPLDSSAADRVVARSRSVSVSEVRIVEGSSLLLAEEHGCDLEFHEVAADGALELDTANRITERLDASLRGRPAQVQVRARAHPTEEALVPDALVTDVTFPIDAVYTWVDGDDLSWRAEHDRYLADHDRALRSGGTVLSEEAANAARYLDREDLRYSLRSLHLFADWVDHVYLVTCGQVPSWLATEHPRLTIVDHRDIFPDAGVLPTFNSHAIEACLHRIDGLAEHYLYVNDDVHLGRRVAPELFFAPNGSSRFFPSKHQLEPGPPIPGEPPVLSAGKNVRDLLHREFGRTVTHKVRHTPHPQQRSIHLEMEERFPEVYAATRASRFRDPADLSIASVLHHHYAYLVGRAEPATCSYVYLDSADPDLLEHLAWIDRARDRDAFCLNDTTAGAQELAAVDAAARGFLARYFPGPSPYERAGGASISKRPGRGK